jgi:cobyrinic acid a,c-diamide synthase
MGFYDGIGGGEAASTYQLARLTRTPVVLLLDARGSCLSLAATLQGFRDFRPDNGIAGVVLNRASPRQEEKLPPILWRETGITVFGALPDLPEARLESRHLGLVTPAEVPERQEKMQLLASLVTKHLDLVDFLAVAAGADDLVVPKEPSYPVLPSRPRLGVALDAAFAFYYQDNLDLLRHFGAELVFFSPLADPTLPPDLAGLYFGGGYPELHARELAENVSLREEIRSRVKEGMPVLAECGGFLYLQTGLGDPEGQVHPMLGVLPGVSQPGDKPGLFGYLSLTAKKDNLLCRKGGVLRGHSFHYWQTSHPGSDWRFTRADGSQTGEAGWATPSLFASFTHIHFASNPTAAQRLVAAAAAWRT